MLESPRYFFCFFGVGGLVVRGDAGIAALWFGWFFGVGIDCLPYPVLCTVIGICLVEGGTIVCEGMPNYRVPFWWEICWFDDVVCTRSV